MTGAELDTLGSSAAYGTMDDNPKVAEAATENSLFALSIDQVSTIEHINGDHTSDPNAAADASEQLEIVTSDGIVAIPPLAPEVHDASVSASLIFSGQVSTIEHINGDHTSDPNAAADDSEQLEMVTPDGIAVTPPLAPEVHDSSVSASLISSSSQNDVVSAESASVPDIVLFIRIHSSHKTNFHTVMITLLTILNILKRRFSKPLLKI